MRQLYIWVAVIMALFITIGCGDANFSTADKSDDSTGSIAFRVIWKYGPMEGRENQTRALDDCLGVSVVAASVYDDQSRLLAQNDWPCSAHSGTISAVPAGANRTLVLYGRDSENGIAYYGRRTGIEVVANVTNTVEDLVATYTVPELLQPSQDAVITNGPVVLQWTAVPGVLDYYVAYAEDEDFNISVESELVANTSYSLTRLAADTTYYWSVWPRYTSGDNEEWGLETQRQRFSTSAEYTSSGTLPAPEELYTDPADTKITISWSAVQGAEGYYLYFREAASVDLVQTITTGNSTQIPLEGTGTIYEHLGLTNGRVYSYAISSYNTTGESSLTAQEEQIPAWSNNYKPDQWDKQWISSSVDFDNEDWYVIDVKGEYQLLQVACQFTHNPDSDIDMELLDAAGYAVQLADSIDDNEVIEHLITWGGLYYIRVYTTGPAASYDLQWTTTLGAITVPGDYADIQEAILAAEDGDIILVADGTYYPSDDDGFDFMGKAITLRSENGPESCVVNAGGNGRGFIFYSGEQTDSIVSGFTITGGVIDGWSVGGGGILCDGSSPTIRNCIIKNNRTEAIAWGGGGISCVDSAAPVIVNCLIQGNSAVDADGGGGIYCDNSSPTIRNCTIVNNSAGTETGGGIYLFGSSSVVLANSIFWNNTPDQIDNDLGTINITYSNIQGGFTGTGNIDSNPNFALTSTDYYSLSSESPCIDTGTALEAPSSDIRDIARPQGAGYDMGAYESH